MKAVVLVGGGGTRLRPLTETTPKPLLPFMNRPLLHHVLDHLAEHGVEEAILSSPYLEERFRGFLAERSGAPTLTWVTEPEPLGTFGAIAGAASHLDRTFLALNGDVVTDLDLTALVGFHRERQATATIALVPVADARPFGLVETEADGRILAFREKPEEPKPGTINAGTYVLEPEVLEGAQRGRAISIERETFPALIASGRPLFGHVWDGYWRDLGTPASYLQAHHDALGGAIRLPAPLRRPLLAGTARVDRDALVGDLVVIGPRCVIAAGARIDGSVLHEGVTVGSGAIVEGSVVGAGAVIGPAATLRGSVLGAGARVEPGTVVEEARLSGASG